MPMRFRVRSASSSTKGAEVPGTGYALSPLPTILGIVI